MIKKYDDLTGLVNRDTLYVAIEEEIKKSVRESSSFSIGLLDVDNWKKINDKIGHENGDKILKDFVNILKKNCRNKDLLGRFGGEEFIFLLPNTEKEESLILLEDIRRLVTSKTFKTKKGAPKENINITFSAGISAFPKDGENGTALIRNADNAMLMAKKYGRNRVCLAVEEKMVLKSNYYTKGQLDRLARIARKNDVTESFLLREALDFVVEKYETLEFEKRKKIKKT